MSFSWNTYLKLIRASAVYDVLLSAPFATPWTFRMLHGWVSNANQKLGGGPLTVFLPQHILVACLMATVVLIWSTLRIVEPTVRLGRFDGTGRFLFTIWMGWVSLSSDTPVLLLLIVPAFAWGIAQWWPVRAQTGIVASQV